MTVRVERTFDIPASPADVWAFIADPGKRASAISVVDSYELTDEGAVWHVRIPVVGGTVRFETRDLERREPEYVKFEGRSKVANVVGEHELAETEGGCRLTNRFVVEGRLPGVERFFEKRLDDEFDRLEHAITEDIGADGADADTDGGAGA